MTVKQLQKKARKMGINPGRLKKADLIHKIQKAEGNAACYGSGNVDCMEVDCCFRTDCLNQ